jgi:hypothetical protein
MMDRWARIKGGICVEVVEQESMPLMSNDWEQVPQGVSLGMFKEPGGTWAAAAPKPTRLSLGAFWRRFTPAEREVLQNILATGTQAQKNKLNAFRDYLLFNGYVEIPDAYITDSVNAMVAAGVIAAPRASAILATE